MKKLYIITGAAGHLGSTVIGMLKGKDCEVRGLILPEEQAEDTENVTFYKGDVTKPDTLRPLFENRYGKETYVIHTAGIVDIQNAVSPLIYNVNVNGTKNILRLCREYGVKRLVYVSSVHAIPEGADGAVIREVASFAPESVTGGYAKTKAEATEAVLAAAKSGLDAVVVHPSGIIGPFCSRGNHIVQLISDYISGKLPACVRGGYDFVDVRDVAAGCISAALRGVSGSCYILSNRYYEIKDILAMIRAEYGGRKLPVLPLWAAKAAAPFFELYAKIRHIRPLFTRYSLHALSGNDKFSHEKAAKDLNFRPRDLCVTIRDTVSWLKKHPYGSSQSGLA